MNAPSMLHDLAAFSPDAFISKAAGAAAPRLIDKATNFAAAQASNLMVTLGIGFRPHIEATYNRCYRIKTLIYRERPVELLSQYVSIGLRSDRVEVDDNSLIEDLEIYKAVIVTGSAGSGKTMFMKYLALSRFHNPRGRLPLFVELRNLDYRSGLSLMDLIFRESASADSRISRDQFEEGLKKGLFIVILDGLDEVDPRYRESIHKELMSLPVRYPENIAVVSSRKDERLYGWSQFTVFNVLPLTKEQVADVISRIDFAEDTKAKFLKALSSGDFESYKTFLQNPLLTTIMLLRYDQFASLSKKVHIFYDQAFDTLFFRHDVSKGVYERKRYAPISLDDFKKFFATFCFSTYYKSVYAFTRHEIIEAIESSLSYCGIKADPDAVLKDLLESICIIQEDGLNFTFVHRSFQEFFAALFLVSYRGSKLGELVSWIMERSVSENAGFMLFEMARDLVEQHWSLPKVKRIETYLKELDPDDPARFAENLFWRMTINPDGEIEGQSQTPLAQDISIIDRYYVEGEEPTPLDIALMAVGFPSLSLLLHAKGFGDDPRFKILFSNGGDDDNFDEFQAEPIAPLVLEERDNEWLMSTNAPEVFRVVKGRMLRLADEVAARVRRVENADALLL